MPSSRDLVPSCAQEPRIPIARLRSVYRPADVERRLGRLPPKEHEQLRSTYERMLEKGPERFEVKPAGVPAMEHLYDELPNFAEVPIDASHVIWVATANDERAIPDPILNRVNVFEVGLPDRDAARVIATRLYASIRASHDWGGRFEPQPEGATLERLAGRDRVAPQDLPETGPRRTPIGFVQ